MFTTIIKIIDTDWNELDVYKSRIKPSVGEYIYSYKASCYYKVVSVVHTIGLGTITKNEILIVVQLAENQELIGDKQKKIE
jgi:hypothetical protein